MLTKILCFDLRFRAKKISTYIYFALFFCLGFFPILWAGGAFETVSDLKIGAGAGSIHANAPYVLFYLITMFSNLGILITSAFFGYAAFRDFKENTHVLYFSYPVKKMDYFAGKFLSGLMTTLFVFSGTGLGALLASASPFVEPAKIGAFHLSAYIQPYLIGVLPNVFFAGALFFSFALLTRRIFPVYVGSIAMFTGYLMASSLLRSHSDRFFASLIDPFGIVSSRGFYLYWTPAQKNSFLIPLENYFLYNRLLWVTLGILLLVFAYRKFRFTYMLESKRGVPGDSPAVPVDGQGVPVGKSSESSVLKEQPPVFNQPAVRAGRVFTFKNHLRQLLNTVGLELRVLFKNIYFLSILLIGVLFMFFKGYTNIGIFLGTHTYPVTYQVLDITAGIFSIFILLLTIFCSGEMVWRERERRVNEIYDSLPIPEWVPGSKRRNPG
ncbi:MAG: hypothetical protein GY757_42830 [bacterium]|nr:hypothetical protein [bacterium]